MEALELLEVPYRLIVCWQCPPGGLQEYFGPWRSILCSPPSSVGSGDLGRQANSLSMAIFGNKSLGGYRPLWVWRFATLLVVIGLLECGDSLLVTLVAIRLDVRALLLFISFVIYFIWFTIFLFIIIIFFYSFTFLHIIIYTLWIILIQVLF